MEFAEVVRQRRMTRAYAPDPVDPAVLERALDHATRAPSAGFSQGWAFVVLDTPETVRGFWEAQADTSAPDRWLAGMMSAPVVVVPCSRRDAYLERYAEADKRRAGLHERDESRWAMPYWHLDTAMAALLLLQSVTDAGLGACFFGLVPSRVDAVKEVLGLVDTPGSPGSPGTPGTPGSAGEAPHPIGAITIGHPAPDGSGARGSASRRRRTPWREVAHRGRWGAGWA
ncbi:nitroreductase family protein [Pimelobacter simplex]|uniref:nitroreductase family protein n=1 Tax=Nocardioides simplex TaxID=2045 RepID=UPI00214FB553|nr:nitroreductase family protein [Pimelobacter simplex]UUW90260.1 nitroreductase family protein [Pimelobacter simplex]UUW94089.1 nitroreductase family protein [Pimelobacter simplex]